MRRVGYEDGFLPGEPMAFHVYCLTGTDGDGPTTPFTKELCKFNDGDQMKQRASDLLRLHTAGFVTEFGAVSDKPTGLAQVQQVLDSFDRVAPSISWCFWADIPSEYDYRRELARAYPHAVAGDLLGFSFNGNTSALTVRFRPGPSSTHGSTAPLVGRTTEILLPTIRYNSTSLWAVEATPADCCIVNGSAPGLLSIVVVKPTAEVQITVAMR
jgi:hypothetical protein